MTSSAEFWKLTHLDDSDLLQSLAALLRTKRQTLAQLVAHLGEVEDRRLHLQAAYPSMFAYCVTRLGMSEDEACRRLELARLARRFPVLFSEIAGGSLTLSVALLLKPVLSAENHRELLAAARGKSMQQTRELIAQRFPRPDVPSRVRKLPEQAPVAAAQTALPPASLTPHQPPPPQASSDQPVPLASSARPAASSPASNSPALAPRHAAQLPSRQRTTGNHQITPLSALRYRIQFTADANLKQKLELARELSRHANPDGDFAPLIERALDLLLEQLQSQRFGAVKSNGKTPTGDRSRSKPPATCSPAPAQEVTAPVPLVASSAPTASASPTPRRSPISRAARRAIVERDGLGCTWTSADGTRCGSQAWLEFDHRHPAGKGGSSEPENLRLFCQAHNQLAAEQAYGRARIELAKARRRGRRRSTPTATSD
jgi:5-methylcytosine-specific restriction endonuclease McrA